MHQAIAILPFLALSAIAADKTVDPALDTSLKTAATQLDRLALLPDDKQWSFDFTAQQSYTFSPGSVVNANAATFPAAVGNGQTMATINLGPCSMLPPHYHPRASNFVVGVTGNVTTYMIQENSARLVTETLSPGKMTIFPQASVHSMVNNDCSANAQLISALSSEDAGTHNIANALFQLPDSIRNAAFGNPSGGVPAFNVPTVGFGAIQGDPACLAKCNKSP